MGLKDEDSFSYIFSTVLKQSFHAVSLTLLSLLHPLSFLLLARINSPTLPFTSNSIILFSIVSSLSLSSLFSSLTGHPLGFKLPAAVSWAFLCLYQACITFGVEAALSEGSKPPENSGDAGGLAWLKRALLFAGIYDQTILWKREVVRPVVDDTVYREERGEGGAERLMVAASFGALWLWLLQGEVQPLVSAVGKGRLREAAGRGGGFFLWLVSFATVMVGFVRAVELSVWLLGLALQLVFRRGEREGDGLAQEVIDV